jgi:hypothetical protein
MTDTTHEEEEDHGSTGGKLREIFGTGSLTSGKVTGGTGGSGNIVDGDVNTGGSDGVDTTGAGPTDPAGDK